MQLDTGFELVKTQVGFDVILLDSKLFPLTDNNSATGVDFWRSTRKVIKSNSSKTGKSLHPCNFFPAEVNQK